MTKREAYKILDVFVDASPSEIKKKYRQLMLQAHPDNQANHVGNMKMQYTAQEINEAYSILIKNNDRTIEQKTKMAADVAQSKRWNAPQNPHAFTEREIFHYVEDADGEILGNISIAKGKFLWTKEEDFPLFLISMYQCSKTLLDECDQKLNRTRSPENRNQIQAKLTYLLTQQFIDGYHSLQSCAKMEKDEQGKEIFYIDAMLELNDTSVKGRVGDLLFPSALKKHRLYLKNKTNQELGYLSFSDDRLYYIVIPLFEQKRVQVKLQLAANHSNDRRKQRYQKVDLWIKMKEDYSNSFPESLDMQIEKVLEEYMDGMLD